MSWRICVFRIRGKVKNYSYQLLKDDRGTRCCAVGWGTSLKAGRSRVPFPVGSWSFFIDLILPAALFPWDRLSNENYLLGVKGAGVLSWQLYQLHVPMFWKFWEPQTPGALGACPGLYRDGYMCVLLIWRPWEV